MANIESLIQNSEKLTEIFGQWPSFHDAEILDLHLWRGHVDTDKGIYEMPILTLRIHVWQLTKEVDADGHLICRHPTLTTLRFGNVEDFEMHGFNHQNPMLELSITRIERMKRPTTCFAVEVTTDPPAFGMSESFKCLEVEVVDATPCAEWPARSQSYNG